MAKVIAWLGIEVIALGVAGIICFAYAIHRWRKGRSTK